jgi:hypothetical protein
MKFEEALVELRKGKIIYLRHVHKKVELNPDGNFMANFSLDDMFYGEWDIKEEPGKTFPEVFEAFKEGKRIKRKCWHVEKYIHNIFTSNSTWSLYIDDLLSTDWEIIG